MSYKLNKIDNEKNISKKNIIKILNDNKINCQIIDIKYHNFKKVFIKIKENEEIYFLKLCLDPYSINLSKNENIGYSYFALENKLNFKLPHFKLININENYGLSKIKLVDGKKGKYFDFYKFYPTNLKYELDNIQLKDYINLINNKFNIKNNDLINKAIDKFLKKFGEYNIPLDVSHGDFIHWNTIRSLEKNYIIDLEFFEKKRPYLYDYFHWFLTPIINKMIKFDLNFPLINSPNFIIIKILKLGLKKRFNQIIIRNKILFKLLLVLFTFERYLVLNHIINLKNINELINNEEKVQTSKHLNILLKMLKKFV